MLTLIQFLSTLSLRRATCAVVSTTVLQNHFYPRSPCGERRCYGLRYSTQSRHFYPRSPCGERRDEHHANSQQEKFLSTLSLRRATCTSMRVARHFKFLSTLSLRRATRVFQRIAKPFRISIHALLAESDGGFGAGSWRLVIFLSTRSLRRATPGSTTLTFPGFDFYPRSPCGERLSLYVI